MKKIIQIAAILVFIVNGLNAQVPAEANTGKRFREEFDLYIKDLLKNIDIPAIGISIVANNKPVFVNAYGFANKETGIKADSNTLFYIASTTKSFTALAAAILDQEGIIKLDDPIEKYMGSMKFKNPVPVNQITIRHLLIHTSGLENDALTYRLAFTGDVKESDIDLVFTDVTTFKSSMFNKYDYTNLGYNIYTILVKNVLGINWKNVLAKKIFQPLGMNRTTAYMTEAAKNGWTVVSPYIINGHNGAMFTGLPKEDNTMQSAGGLISSPNDLAKWLLMNINKGVLGSTAVYPKSVLEKCQTGYANVQRNIEPFTGMSQYGLGWIIGDYKKEQVIYHLGGFAGYSAHISFMPNKKIGVAITTNESFFGPVLTSLLAGFVYDWWLNEAAHVEIYEKKKEEIKSKYEAFKTKVAESYEEKAKRPSKLSLPLSEYTGSYNNPFGGSINIAIKESNLWVQFGVMQSKSTFFTQRESIRVELAAGNGDVIIFKKDESNKVTSLLFNDVLFTKQ